MSDARPVTATQRRGASPRRLDQIGRPPDALLLDVHAVDTAAPG
jgi:hypothetical protein